MWKMLSGVLGRFGNSSDSDDLAQLQKDAEQFSVTLDEYDKKEADVVAGPSEQPTAAESECFTNDGKHFFLYLLMLSFE